MYRIAKDCRLPSRSADRSIAELCDCRRDAEGGRKDERGGTRFDRNCLRFLRRQTGSRVTIRSWAMGTSLARAADAVLLSAAGLGPLGAIHPHRPRFDPIR
jgi:hypothetical protein